MTGPITQLQCRYRLFRALPLWMLQASLLVLSLLPPWERVCLAEDKAQSASGAQSPMHTEVIAIYYKDYKHVELPGYLSVNLLEGVNIISTARSGDPGDQSAELKNCLTANRCDCYGKYFYENKMLTPGRQHKIVTIVENNKILSIVLDAVKNTGRCLLPGNDAEIDFNENYTVGLSKGNDLLVKLISRSLRTQETPEDAMAPLLQEQRTELDRRQARISRLTKAMIAVGILSLVGSSLLIASAYSMQRPDCDINLENSDTSLQRNDCLNTEDGILKLKLTGNEKVSLGLQGAGGIVIGVSVSVALGVVIKDTLARSQ